MIDYRFVEIAKHSSFLAQYYVRGILRMFENPNDLCTTFDVVLRLYFSHTFNSEIQCSKSLFLQVCNSFCNFYNKLLWVNYHFSLHKPQSHHKCNCSVQICNYFTHTIIKFHLLPLDEKKPLRQICPNISGGLQHGQAFIGDDGPL